MSQIQFVLLCGGVIISIIVVCVVITYLTNDNIWKKMGDFSYIAETDWVRVTIVYDKDIITSNYYKNYSYPELYRIELLLKEIREEFSMSELKELFHNDDKLSSFGVVLLYSSLYNDPLYGKSYHKSKEKKPYDWIHVSDNLSSKIRITLISLFTLTFEFNF